FRSDCGSRLADVLDGESKLIEGALAGIPLPHHRAVALPRLDPAVPLQQLQGSHYRRPADAVLDRKLRLARDGLAGAVRPASDALAQGLRSAEVLGLVGFVHD